MPVVGQSLLASQQCQNVLYICLRSSSLCHGVQYPVVYICLMTRPGMLMRSQATCSEGSLFLVSSCCSLVWIFILNALVYDVALVDGGNADLSTPVVCSCATASVAPGLFLWCHTCVEFWRLQFCKPQPQALVFYQKVMVTFFGFFLALFFIIASSISFIKLWLLPYATITTMWFRKFSSLQYELWYH